MKKVFGFVRYSILTDNRNKKKWNISKHLTYEQLKENLFARERLEQRGFLFENFTLPSMESNLRDWCDLRLIVFTSESLPDWHLKFLNSLKEKYSFIEIHLLGTQTDCLNLAANKIIEESVEPGEVYGTFRIDDDDAISNTYIDSLKRYLEHNFAGMAITFPKGYSAFFDFEKNIITTYGETYVPMNAQGLCLISKKEMSFKHVFDLKSGGHRNTDKIIPVILLSQRHSYLRILHDNASMYFNKNTMQQSIRTRSKMHAKVSSSQILDDINIASDLIQAESEAINISRYHRFKRLIYRVWQILKTKR